MQFYRRHSKLIKISGFIVVTSSSLWVVDQVRKAYDILNHALDTSVIDFMEPVARKSYDEEKDYIVIKWLQTRRESESVFAKVWHSLKFGYARRLMSLTNSDNEIIRMKAIRQLGRIKSLDNWHYSLLAHMCSAGTAVALARTEGVDLRFFLEPPYRYMTYNHQMITSVMKEFLMALSSKSKHPCVGYFISKAFVDVQDLGRIIDYDTTSVELTRYIQSSNDILPLCLESVYHHSTIEPYARDIVLLNGLPLLMELYKRFEKDFEVKVTLCKIISNISEHPELLEDIFKSGWIGVLAEWVKDRNIRISVPAARALANLDKEYGYSAVYNRRIHLLHPMLRDDEKPIVDVVLVHGLLGGVFFTWRQRNKNEATLGFFGKKKSKESFKPSNESTMEANIMKSSDPKLREYLEDVQEQQKLEWDRIGEDYEMVCHDIPINANDAAEGPYTCPGNCKNIKQQLKDSECYTHCWPQDWLSEDCSGLRILGINYDTNLSMWAPMCPAENMKMTLNERSDDLMKKLLSVGIGERPIIWITHSMGGLLVKNMLCKSFESKVEEHRNMCLNTRGIVFCSTPHLGSRLACLSQPTALLLWPSVEVQELREESPALVEMHQKFLNMVEQIPMKIISFVETKSTLVSALKINFILVDPRSANPGVGECFEIPLDHLGICKPANRQSFLYQKILHLIQNVIINEKKNYIDFKYMD